MSKISHTIAILATGDEITQGSVLNTNAAQIAHQLFSHGLAPEWHMSVSDDTSAIEAALAILLKQHTVVIIMGGLGPTSDDKTRFALSNYLQTSLVRHQASFELLATRYQALDMPFTALSQQQALFPEHAEIMSNSTGSANGCCCKIAGQSGEQWIFMLPGPPHECLPMFETHVLPRLIAHYATGKTLLQWQVFGVPEGMIAEKMDIALKPYETICRTSFRWHYPYVDCKVLLDAHAPEKAVIVVLLNQLLSPYQLNAENQMATEKLKHMIQQSPRPIFIQDEATGGILESRLRAPASLPCKLFFGMVPSSEQHAADYYHITGLNNYWAGETQAHESELIITAYHGAKKNTQTIQIPFRSARLNEYAAELIAHHIAFYHTLGITPLM